MTSALIDRMMAGDRRALARLFTVVERGGQQAIDVTKALQNHCGNSFCIGVTGPPGAGKSTIVDRLIKNWREKEISVGVLAVDPTSPLTGGAVLGDRIRMQSHFLDKAVFIRSFGTRGIHGGLSQATRVGVRLLDAFGKDVIVVETVGVGQTELDIMQIADTVVVILVPEAGDAVQTMKAGLMEIADLFVVNKMDRPGADKLASDLREMIRLGQRSNWRPPVLQTQGFKGYGIAELDQGIAGHRAHMESNGTVQLRRQSGLKKEFLDIIEDTLGSYLPIVFRDSGTLSFLLEKVENGELDPRLAVDQVLSDPVFFAMLAEMPSSSKK